VTLDIDQAAAASLASSTYAGEVVFNANASLGSARIACVLNVLSADWTDFSASGDARVVYVSSSGGDDANDGLSPVTPKRTIAAGKALMRDGFPDWLLLERGDSFDEPIGQWIASGRSTSEPMLIGGYGNAAERPVVRTGAAGGIATFAGGASPSRIDHVALVGIHLLADGYTGTELPIGVSWLLPSDDFLIEDCLIEGFQTNVLVQGYYGSHSHFHLRRSVIVDAFSTGNEASSHGLYLSNVNGALIEGNVFDHNGWDDSVPNAVPTIYRHNIYVQGGPGGCSDVVVRGNILSRAASHGLQLRPGGIVFENLFLQNSIALLLGGGNEPTPGGVDVIAVRNVVLDGKDIDLAHARGWGIETCNIASGVVSDNIIAQGGAGALPIPLDLHGNADGIGIFNTTVAKNIVWNWGGSVLLQGDATQLGGIDFRANDVSNSITAQPLLRQSLASSVSALVSESNRFHSGVAPPGSWFAVWNSLYSLGEWQSMVGDVGSAAWTPLYPDPERTIATYNESLGAEPTLVAFMRAARAQSRTQWHDEYTAHRAISYFRQGFGRP